jgi:hypothetical protein
LIIEKFFKTNIENMFEDRKARIDIERKEELDAISRKAGKELIFKRDFFEWKLIKLTKQLKKTKKNK